MPIDWSLLTPTAPAGPATLPTPQQVIGTLDQSEWIQYDDLAQLAGRLVKQKSEHHQRIGRTISKMLRGELYAAPEPRSRNQTLYQVAGEILEGFPYCSPDSVVEHFRISLDRMAEETNAKWPENPAPTCTEFRAMLVRHQGPKQGKHATITEAMAAIDAYGPLAVPQHLPTPAIDVANSWGQQPQPQGPTAAELAGLDRRSLIVRVSDSQWLLRHPSAATYDLKVSSKSGLAIELQRRFVDAALPLELTDDDGQMLAIDEICRSYAMNAHATIYDYSATSTTFDQQSSLVRFGIQMGRLPDLRIIEPQHSDAVEFWLYTLCGGTDAALIDLYDWIASTDQRHINHAAAALVLVGPPGVGKTQLARGLAMTWGSSEPVALQVAIDRFNGDLTRCPIWFADEHMPKDLDQATFRRWIQDRQRTVERKGQERALLDGCSRVLLAVNDLRDIAITASGANADSIQATAGRLAIYETCRDSVCIGAMLEIANGDQRTETLAIARHLRSIQLTETPRDQRFYGARNNERSTDHLMSSAFVRCPAVANALADYLSDPISWERQYNVNAPAELGIRYPVFVDVDRQRGRLSHTLQICSTELTAKVGLRQQDEYTVKAALQPFAVGEAHRISFGGKNGRFRGSYLTVNAAMLAKTLQVETDVLTMTTEARRKEQGISD